MKHLTFISDENIYKSAMLDFYFGNMKIGALDIETTGLNPSRNKFILGGLYDFSEKTVHQFFAENRNEEGKALASFISKLSEFDMVITYNGRHFDLPFIEKRRSAFKNILSFTSHASYSAASSSEAVNLEKAINSALPYNLDLYLVLNGHSPVKRFVPNLKQKTVESYMGLWQNRDDEISGAESVELYNTYEITNDPLLEKKILLHNSDDILQLTRLLRIISKSDFHKAMFSLGFPVKNLTVEKIIVQKDSMTVKGIQRDSGIDYMGFSFGDYPVETKFDKKDASFIFKFPLITNSGLIIADLDAAYIDRGEFEKYPESGSGFLVLQNNGEKNYMEINHFIKSFISMFLEKI